MVKISDPITIRGMEVKKSNYYDTVWNNFGSKDSYVKDVDKVVVGKGRTRSRANTNSYNLNIWL